MQDEHSEEGISRRAALGVIAGAGAGLAAGLGPLADDAAARPKHPRRTRGSARGAHTIMLVRHGEKPDEDGEPPLGVTLAGANDTESLTVRGWTRAGALPGLFAPARARPRKGLVRPTSLFASDPGATGSKRPLQTITPLSERLGLPIATEPIDDELNDSAAIARLMMAAPGAPLGSWQHRLIPIIARNLGRVRPAVPKKWPEARYDVVWVFTRQAHGWRFTQVPQLLVAGDSATAIT